MTAPADTTTDPAASAGPLRRWWAARGSVTRQWIINVVVGLGIHLALVIMHSNAPLAPVQNMALDRVMRINAVLDPPSRAAFAPPQQTFIDIDEATWRSASWGGGEPYRAPRQRLLDLLAKAFEQGAAEVVLDIGVEGTAARAAEAAEDALFAAGLQKMLDDKTIGPRQLLVLVRSVRPPLPGPGKSAYLDELRAAPAVDSLLARGDPRVVLAAPYFDYSGDRVLRDWKLLSVLCERGAGTGTVRVLPSVQLVVMAHRVGLADSALPWRRPSNAPCVPFPASVQDTPANAQAMAHNDAARLAAQDSYWQSLAALLPARGIKFGATAPADGSLGNRLIYRSAYPFASTDPWFERMPVPVLLAADGSDMLAQRVVIIGQSYSDAGDVHFTPLGTMPGSVVLVNAIDSMARYGLVEATSVWISLPLALLAIVVIGYVFARLDSFSAKLISTGVVLLLFAVASVYLFRSGLWLDFALPLVGIQMYQTLRGHFEKIDKLRRKAGIRIGNEEPHHA
jgi:CHASE2 domain-containing sensor protein